MRLNGGMAQTAYDATASEISGLTQFRRSLTRKDWVSLAGMAWFIVLLHVVGFGLLFGLVAPSIFFWAATIRSSPLARVLAYTLGMRHASTPTTSRPGQYHPQTGGREH